MSKADVLRQYEAYGYQIAYYLLENESMAAEAAISALKELAMEETFFRQPSATRQQLAKKAFMKHAVKAKATAMNERMVTAMAVAK